MRKIYSSAMARALAAAMFLAVPSAEASSGVSGVCTDGASSIDQIGVVNNIRDRGRGSLRARLSGGLTVTVFGASSEARHDRWGRKLDEEVLRLELRVENDGPESITDGVVRLEGREIESEPVALEPLAPGHSEKRTLAYLAKSVALLPPLDPDWDENVPVSLAVRYRVGGKDQRVELPVDYRFYTGWYTPPDRPSNLIEMAIAPQPGLAPLIERIRAAAEGTLGHPIDDTAASRLAAARAAAVSLRRYGASYQSDPLYIRQGRVLHGSAQFPVETLYYGGDCEDLSILLAHALNRLGVPFAIGANPLHVTSFVVLHRGPGAMSVPAPFNKLLVETTCGGERCVVLPVDLTIGLTEIEANTDADWFEATVAAGRVRWTETHPQMDVLVTSDAARSPGARASRRSWLGAMTWMPPAHGERP